jgi:hypothetical protein
MVNKKFIKINKIDAVYQECARWVSLIVITEMGAGTKNLNKPKKAPSGAFLILVV